MWLDPLKDDPLSMILKLMSCIECLLGIITPYLEQERGTHKRCLRPPPGGGKGAGRAFLMGMCGRPTDFRGMLRDSFAGFWSKYGPFARDIRRK